MPEALNYDERHTLEAILRHHGLADNHVLQENLETFAVWVREGHVSRLDRHGPWAELSLVLLSKMGIYGSSVLEKKGPS